MVTTTHTLLSVDDSKAVHAFIQRSFDGSPFQVVHAYSAADATKVLNERSAQFSLILLDWEMPEMSGPEYLPILKERFPHLPVIMLTSKNAAEDIEKMLLAGASEYIMKPFTPDILIEKINSVLGI